MKFPAALSIASTLADVRRVGLFADVSTPALLAAMWANASGESNFNPAIVGDSGNSVGLFQCNMRAGLGKGHTAAQLADGRYNAAVVLAEALRLWNGDAPHAVPSAPRASAYALTDWWCRYIERPADPDLRSWQRVRWLQLAGIPDGCGFTDLARALGSTVETTPGASSLVRGVS